MSVKFVDNTGAVRGELQQKGSIFLRSMLDRIVDIARPNTPKREGNLRRDTLKQVLGLHGRIEWRKAYASVQERGSRRDGSYKIKKYSTPGTGPHFAEKAVEDGIKDTNVVARRVF